MNIQLYIVLGIMAFMILAFVLNKWPFGVTTMTCCALLVVTGVYTAPQAFSGLCNQNVLLLAGMFVISTAFSKTTLLEKIQQKMTYLKGKNGLVLIIALFAVIIALSALLPTTAEMTMMLLFIVALGNSGDITPSRMTIPVLAMLSVWGAKIPLGLGATYYAMVNALYEGMATDSSQLLTITDPFKLAIIPCIILTIYCMFAYKLMPNHAFKADELKTNKKEKVAIPKKQENIIYAVFVIVMILMFFNRQLGPVLYVVPIIGALVLVYTKAMSVKEVVGSVTVDAVWMAAGVVVMANALGATGAGEVIGNFILTILGGNPSSLFVLIVFAVVTVVMTTFMSNTATMNVLVPIAASTCLAAGWDPRGVILIVVFCSNVAIAFPSGSPACGIAYAAGGYKLTETFKFTLPFILIAVVSVVVCAELFYPIL